MKNIIDILDQRKQLDNVQKRGSVFQPEIIEHIRSAVEPTAGLNSSQEAHLGRCLNIGPGSMLPIHYATILATWINGCHSARIG